jgi:signal transduction histidine kinase
MNTLGVSAFTLIVVSALGMYFTYRSQRQAVSSEQAFVAQNAASDVEAFVQDKFGALHSAVRFNYLAGIPATDPTSTLQRLLSLEPSFSQVALLNTQQKVVGQVSRLPDLYTSSITSRVDKNQLLQSVKQGKDFTSQVYINKASSEPEVLMAVPISSVYTGFSGTLVAETNLKFMWDLVGSIKDGDQGLAYVVNKQGRLIAAGDTSRVLRQENLSQLTEVKRFLQANDSVEGVHSDTSKGFNGTNVISTYAALGTPDWAVVTEIPVGEAYAPVIRSMAISMALILMGVAVSTVVSIWYARRITKPIIALRDVVNRFGAGELEAKIAITANNEVGELGKAFNDMADNLHTSTTKLHEERIKLKASIDSLNIGFLMIDLAGEVMLNPEAHAIVHYDSDGKIASFEAQERLTLKEIDGKLGSTIGLIPTIDEALKTLKPIERKAVDFNSHILRIFVAPILNVIDESSSTLGTVVLIEDITEAKIHERSKDEFFSIASHELRTPLTSIRGNSSMILNYFQDALKDEQLKEMVEDMHASSVRLIEIVNDFLDLSRLEQGKMNFSYAPISVEKVIEGVAYEMKAVLDEKKLYLKIDKLTLDRLPTVWVDENRLKQVVYNLVGNAAKFTEAGGITISAEPEPDQHFVKVLVSDTGRGMTPESQRLLFHKFQQASSSLLTRDTTRGTGLGLYISKMIVENMGGKIALEHSQSEKGSVFSFTLPIATDEQRSSVAKPDVSVKPSATVLPPPSV